MAAPRWVTPRVLPDGVNTITIDIPNRAEYRAILRGILLEMANPVYWQQVPGYTISACDAATWAAVILESFEAT